MRARGTSARNAFCVPKGEGGSSGRSSKEEVWIDPLSVVSTGHCGQYVATVSSKERKGKRKQKEKKKQKKKQKKTRKTQKYRENVVNLSPPSPPATHYPEKLLL